MPKELLVSKFKARCIAELKEVQRTGQPLIVTLRGKPIARIEAVRASGKPEVLLGARRGDAEIKCDLVKRDFSGEWEMNVKAAQGN